MGIELIPATEAEHDTILRNLYQFYLYEFSGLGNEWRVQSDGRFAETDLDGCWTDPYRRIFLIRVDGALAGFAIIDAGIPDSPGSAETVNEFSELFVMLPYRKQGIGEAAVQQLFDQFRGQWEICIVETNSAAREFWTRVVGRYTNHHFDEVHRPEEHDFMESFNNSAGESSTG